MIIPSYIAIIGIFIIYYLAILILERRFIQEPKEIIEKFLAVTLGYAGISLVYFSLTGKPLFAESQEAYSVYIFIIGFISVIWSIPTLLNEFHFIKNFLKKEKVKTIKPKKN